MALEFSLGTQITQTFTSLKRRGRAGHFGKLQHLKIGKTATASEVYASPGDRQRYHPRLDLLAQLAAPTDSRLRPEVFVPRERAEPPAALNGRRLVGQPCKAFLQIFAAFFDRRIFK